VDLALCYAFDFVMIVVRCIAIVKMVSVSFLSLLSYQKIWRSCAGASRRTISDRFQKTEIQTRMYQRQY